MRPSTIQFSLFSAGLLSFAPLSAQAQLTINNTQNSAIVGDNNQVTQVINQTIIYRPQRVNNSSKSNRSFDKNNDNRNERRDDDKDRGHHHKHHSGRSHGEDRE
jgi:hypothetical protein